ncbi:cytochrome c biogenesis heme-transporting ATPase CcmA [Vibrio marisflavi]|uniref:Cytochrome c biogenesis ATP-binding export protein CcmA n=1 Tax=Vibrio marisflavi CECT 7928 TaxID=634439 RepID=A0ABM9A7T0_9VIBR|nr:cytochrome c biogenesis heme-transporting ATPase CcmA [Vibrio marisflavi]CAH0540760.1 Cytochrome c biogenesis ATP-binding export protein CcmA [Vibrio marisflavi CECT 7928]
MLDVNKLTVVRDERVLFDSLSFSIDTGEIVQIEGRNGAGKTTLLRAIAGLSDCDAGEVLWNKEPIKVARDSYYSELIFLGHQTGIKKDLTAYENLRFFLSIHSSQLVSKNDIYRALTQVGLAGREDVLVSQLSAGQQRRVALARLWLSSQKLWILDEPLTAIDKQGVKVLESLFLSHAKKGGMVLLTTHQDMFTDNNSLRKIRLGD